MTQIETTENIHAEASNINTKINMTQEKKISYSTINKINVQEDKKYVSKK
jgi:hypothetical protein